MPCLKGMALALCALSIARAENTGSWTNRAGHALKASPVSIQGQLVTFKQGSNSPSIDYPLAVFLPAEQERLRCLLNDTTVPAGLKAQHEFARRTLHRSRLLQESGSLSTTNFQRTLETTLSTFRIQAAPFITQQKLSEERLELIIRELVENKSP